MRGSSCLCPHLGQATEIRSGFDGGMTGVLPAAGGTPFSIGSWRDGTPGRLRCPRHQNWLAVTLESGGLRVFGGLGGFAGARQRRRAGRDLVGVDFALAHKGDAFLDDQLG